MAILNDTFTITCKNGVGEVHEVQKTHNLSLNCGVPVRVVKLPEENWGDKLRKSPDFAVEDGAKEVDKAAWLFISLLDNDYNPIPRTNNIVQIVKLRGFSVVKYSGDPVVVVRIKEPPSDNNATYYILKLTFVTEEKTYEGTIQIHFLTRADRRKRKKSSTKEAEINTILQQSPISLPTSVVEACQVTDMENFLNSSAVPMETVPTMEEPRIQELHDSAISLIDAFSENLKGFDKETQVKIVTSVENSIGEAQNKITERRIGRPRAMGPPQ